MPSTPYSTLADMTTAILDASPILRYLILHAESHRIVLRKCFLDGDAPQLRHLELHGVSLATLHPLLSSATPLVSLILERIPSSVYYFSSESVIAHIRTMAQLRTISINFLSATPRLGLTNELFLPPGQTSQARIELPDLKRLVYRGVSTYIESLLARIRAPLIQDIDITFFNQLTLRVPRICTFISELESFRPTTARIDFAQTSARMLFITPFASLQSNESQSQSPDISLSVSCARLDFQVSAMSRICSGLSGTSSISGTGPPREPRLARRRTHPRVPPERITEEWRGEGDDVVDPSLWHTLLTPFRQMRTLRVHVALAADLERALRLRSLQLQQDGLEQEDLFPGLRTIVLLHADDERVLVGASEALRAFIDERNRAGRPVNVDSQDLSRL